MSNSYQNLKNGEIYFFMPCRHDIKIIKVKKSRFQTLNELNIEQEANFSNLLFDENRILFNINEDIFFNMFNLFFLNNF